MAAKGSGIPWRWILGAIAAFCVALLWPQFLSRPTGPAKQELTFDPDLPKFNSSGQSRVCISLAHALPDHVYSQVHPFFEHSKLQSFAVQAREDIPSCIVRPQSAQNVASAVRLLRAEYDAGRDARFAVRSGGHYIGRGHSSIHGGVLLDMSAFDGVTVAEDRKSVVLGTGSRWGSVYEKLDREGLRVAGGRDAGVGVGGLILGGGISSLSPKVGMVCDNVLEYEIVLASGKIEQVSATHFPDLWRALKGGSSNFGVVTRVTARAFPGGPIWGGYKLWTIFSAANLYDAFHDFVSNKAFDEEAASPFISLGYSQMSGAEGFAGFFAYNRPDFEGSWPASLRRFRDLWGVWNTLKKRSVSDLGVELHKQSKEDKRQHYATLTFKNDWEVLQEIPKIFRSYKSEMKKIKGSLFGMVVQPLPATITHKGDPNVFGLESRNVSDPTPIVILMPTEYLHAADDDVVEGITQKVLGEIDAFAKARGSGDEFLYLNYAGHWQDPISSYGPENKKFLQDVSRKYDPNGFYQKALEGGFKLGLYI